MLCHYGSTIVSDTNNNITYIDESIVFLNATTGMSFEDIKNVICEKI
jgi:hypothetical protein